MRLRFLDDGRVQVRTGKVELGQGIRTALTQIAADALGIASQRIDVLAADTMFGPDEGVTSGSLSVQDAGSALRRECVEARATIDAGAGLCLRNDAASPPEGSTEPSLEQDQRQPLANGDAERQVGVSLRRLDLPAKLSGQPVFIHDLVLDGMLYGRVLHPPQDDAELAHADLDAARQAPGIVAVHRDGRLLCVLAERSRDADRAVAALDATWRSTKPWLPDADVLATLTDQPTRSRLVGESGGRPQDGVDRTLKARFRKPAIAHASIGPSCALALWEATDIDDQGNGDGERKPRLRVWSHTQAVFNLRRDLALAFDVPQDAVRVQHVDGAGCYGHNGADDVAFDAAWLARQAPGRPVRVQWSRADELGLAPFGPAMVVALEADLDADGEVLHWRHQMWSDGHSSRPGRASTPALLGAWQTERAFERPPSINVPMPMGGGADRNALPGYAFAAWRVTHHEVKPAAPRSSALRSLGGFANVFAAESFVDEIAHAAGADPLQWRRRHLRHDPRGLAVLQRAAEQAGWAGRSRRDGAGHGIGFARYKGTGAWCAVVAEVEAGAELRVVRLTIAVDVGVAVNPDGVVAQIEGGAIQATSWALKEAVRHDAERVTSDAWESYPILRFSEVPAVDVHIVASVEASLGAGEASLGPTTAAIGNALFDALGVRVRELPLTADAIVAAMNDEP